MNHCIDKVTRFARGYSLTFVVVFGLVACGGGGGGSASESSSAGSSTGMPDTTSATTSMTAASTSILLSATQSDAVNVASTTASDGSTKSTITLPTDVVKTKTVQTGQTIVIPAGQNKQFPLGFAAVVGAMTTDTVTGKVTAEVTPSTLRDAYSKLSAKGSDIPLSADNFIGAVAPLAISGGNAAPTATQTGLLRQTGEVKVFNGALTLTTSKPAGIQAGLDISKPDLALGEINLVKEFKLKDLLAESEASNYQPYGKSGEAKVNVSIKISDLMLTQQAEFTDVQGVPYSLKSLNYKLKGTITGETKLVGGLTGNLGYYSQAWHETEVESVKLLNVSGKLLGLDAKDKIGKIPLAGLVFSLPCAATIACPVLAGTTQTPIRQAAAGGVIVWLYFNAKGQITFEGSVGGRINAGFELGAQQPEGGKLVEVFKYFRKTQDKNLLEAPFVQGQLTAQANLGPSIDFDGFLGGVRFLNLAFDAGAHANLNVNAQIANVLTEVGQPWQWQGNACMTTSVGAGVVATFRIGVGAEVKTGWNKIDNKISDRVGYELQYPTESDRATPGFQYFLGRPVWYTQSGKAMCFPEPMVETSSLSINGTVYNWVVTGKNLPDDLELTLATSGMCGTKPQLNWKAANAGAKATFACSGLTSVSTVSGSFSSAKATNLGGKTQWDWRVANLSTNTNGSCGSSNGVAASSAPSTNLCSTGTASSVTGSGPWNWSCNGSNGGTSASCSATKLNVASNGSCGSSTGVTVSNAPSTNLCSAGVASSVTGSGPWNWSCIGSNGGTTASCSANKQITSTSALLITTTSLPAGTIGGVYAQDIAVTGGQTPYSWSVSSGLPTGLSINASTGAIYGTPSVSGTFSFTVTATDSSSPQKTVSKTLSINVSDTTQPSIAITAPVANGQTYNTSAATVNVSGTSSDNVGVVMVWLDNNGSGGSTATGTSNWSVSGIALQPGANVITVHAVDAAGNIKTTSITVNHTAAAATPTAPTPSSPTGGTVVASTSPTLNWSGGSNFGALQINVSKSPYGSSNIVYTSSWLPAGTTAVTPTGLVAGTSYRWDVTACPSAALAATCVTGSNAYFSTPAAVVTPTAPTPSSPTGGTVVASTNPTLNWSGGSNIGALQINVSKSPYGPSNIVYTSSWFSAGTTSVTPTGLVAGTDYRWDVTACPSAALSATCVTGSNAYFSTPVSLAVNGIASSYSGTGQKSISLFGSGFNAITQISWSCTMPNGISICPGSPFVWTPGSARWGNVTITNDTVATVYPTFLEVTDPAGTYNWTVTFSGGGQQVTSRFMVTK